MTPVWHRVRLAALACETWSPTARPSSSPTTRHCPSPSPTSPAPTRPRADCRAAPISPAQQRLIVDSSAVADLGLRTAIASLIAPTMLPTVRRRRCGGLESRAERGALRFYAELAAAKDPALSFPAPDGAAAGRRRVRPTRSPNGSHTATCATSGSTAASRPSTPRCATSAAAITRNNVVHAQHWRHDDGPHPTLCVIHGFMGSAVSVQRAVLLAAVVLPVRLRRHCSTRCRSTARRAEKGSPFSGYGYFANGFAGFAEAMAQAVHDFRSVIDYLEYTGVDRIALTGMSLGGYTSALIASVDDRIQAVIPNVPVVTPDQDGRRVVSRQQAGRSCGT